MNTTEIQLAELRQRYQAERLAIVNPDYIDQALDRANQEENRWGQIGGHEHIARRHFRANSNKPLDSYYHGPEASLDERQSAYRDFCLAHPELPHLVLE